MKHFLYIFATDAKKHWTFSCRLRICRLDSDIQDKGEVFTSIGVNLARFLEYKVTANTTNGEGRLGFTPFLLSDYKH